MSREFIIFSLSFLGGFFIRSMFSHLFILGTYIKYMQDLEKKFLLLSVSFVQWKAQALTILELTYEHVSEEDKEKHEDYKKIRAKIEEKYDQISERYIKELNEILPYKTKYSNFKEGIQYLEKLMKGR